MTPMPLGGRLIPIPGRQTVLVVDDDESVRALFHRLLSAEAYTVEVAIDGPSALASIPGRSPDVVLLDVDLPGLSCSVDSTSVVGCRRTSRRD